MVKISSYHHTIVRRYYGRNLNGLGFSLLSPQFSLHIVECRLYNDFTFYLKRLDGKKRISSNLFNLVLVLRLQLNQKELYPSLMAKLCTRRQ